MTSGGPRPPAKPAPVSGPGRLSQRTDGGPGQVVRDLPNAAYGEAQAFAQAQQGAPMALAPGALSPSPGGGPSAGPMALTPFGAPSARPDEAISTGAPFGTTPGPESLGLTTPDNAAEEDHKALAAYLPVLEWMSNLPTAMPSMRVLVRKIKYTNGL